ncbi:MAG: hypothetical protein L0Z53_07575, partial [Acidobacteriales bacterium]|nr:hypothetical protein [Terriglobales bacterium]
VCFERSPLGQSLPRPARAPQRVFTVAGKLQAPTAVPQKIAMLKEEALLPEASLGVQGGVPDGVPGGQLGGVLGGIIGGVISNSQKAPVFPPAPRIAQKAPIRVGGRVKPPLQVSAPPPFYPPLAPDPHPGRRED